MTAGRPGRRDDLDLSGGPSGSSPPPPPGAPADSGSLDLDSGSGHGPHLGAGAPARAEPSPGGGSPPATHVDPGSGSGRLPRLDERFEVVRELGRGAMGVVYLARDHALGREVAIKTLRSGGGRDRLARFRREGEIAAALDHPGIVKVHEAGVAPSGPYLVTEYVPEARTLTQLLPRLDRAGRVALVRDAAHALGYAHARGVIHRDVKPDNLLVDRQGRLRVADFGLARVDEGDGLTQTGALLGTPAFMAPEQLCGRREAVGPWSDVWALGVILYRALTGEAPIPAETFGQLVSRIKDPIPPPRRRARDVSPELEAVCLRALAYEPEERYADARELARDLDRALSGEAVTASASAIALPPVWRRASWAAALLPLAGLAAGLGVGLGSGPEAPLDREPPRLVLDPVAPTADGARLLVRGRVEDAAAWVELRHPGGVERVAPGEAFTLELSPAAEPVALVAADPDGNASEPVLLELPRPGPPLPAALSPGPSPDQAVGRVDGSVLVWVPPGEHWRGSDTGDEDEEPAHRIRLSQGFFLGRVEVTRAQFARFCRETGRSPPRGLDLEAPARPDEPIAGVAWEQARDYCAWAGLRLPSEAEWEAAARGGDDRPFPWGERPPGPEHANLGLGDETRTTPGDGDADDGHAGPAPVGSYPGGAASCGALDLAGNVWEWVADRAVDSWRGAARIDPLGPASGNDCVARGGSWRTAAAGARTSNRLRLDNEPERDDVGFRVACSPPPEGSATGRPGPAPPMTWVRGEGGYPGRAYFDASRVAFGVAWFGGYDGGTIRDDLWVRDGGGSPAEVRSARQPSPRADVPLAWDVRRGRLVLYGGNLPGDAGLAGDTWEWDGTAWRELTPPEPTPGTRGWHAMAYDAARGVVVLFGGKREDDLYWSDTWIWDGARWQSKTGWERPPERNTHAMAYDARREVVVLFGGSGPRGRIYGDTWEWDGATWTRREPPVAPSARVEPAMAYDPNRGVVVLFGGHDGRSYRGDTWEWDGSAWVERLPDGAGPPPLKAPALAWDPARERLVLVGGVNKWLSPRYRSELWEYAPR